MTFTIDLEGRRALVTGGGQGVGRAISRFLARAGGEVIVNDYVLERAEQVANEIEAEGGKAQPVAFDVSKFDDVEAAVDGVGGVDILVNNAGNAGAEEFNFGSFTQTKPEDWNRFFTVNLFGVMNCTRAVLPRMVERNDGRIVTIISDAGRWGEATMAAYSAAKAGAGGFTRAIAREVGRHGVTINNVALAAMDTRDEPRPPMTDDEADRFKKAMRSYIIRRRGHPDDVAGLVTYLVSPMASWITGQTYPVNGGYTVNQ